MSKECLVCGKQMGAMTGKVKILDGYVCAKCWAAAGLGVDTTSMMSSGSYTGASLRAIIDGKAANEEKIKNFTPTKKIGNYVMFDDKSHTFVVITTRGFKKEMDLYSYEQIADFELLEDGTSITKGGLGRAVAGGVLFGGVGAVVGGITGGKKTKGVCTSLKIKITLRNAYQQTAYINLIETDTKKDGILYKSSYQAAQEILSALQLIVEREAAPQTASAAPSSAADEILKFKGLLDAGIITAEQFEAKKMELLGL